MKEKCNKIINSAAFTAIIALICFLKTMFFYHSTIGKNSPIEMITITGTLLFFIAFTSFIIVIPNKARFIVTIIVDLLYSILIFADNVYYTFSSSFLSVAQISNMQYGNEIMSAISTLLEVKELLYFMDIVLVIVLIITKKVKIVSKEKYNVIPRIIAICFGIVMLIVVDIIYIQKGSQTLYNKDQQMSETTIFGYHIFDVKNALNVKANTKYKTYSQMKKVYKELKEEYDEKYSVEDYNLKGVLSGKNIIIVQLESVQEFVSNKRINGTEITPNLNKFLRENIEFQNMHMQSYSTTADSEHSTITSLYPVENGMAFSKYYTNIYDDIFKEFKKSGYYTSYMHGNYPYFWNRGNVYRRLTINDLAFKENFSNLSENINGDLSDELLYRQAVDKLKTFDKPFFSYIVAASSHTPFTLEGLQDRNKITVDVGELKDTTFGNYIEAVNYADYAFGIFIEELQKAHLYENTAILVFGDHNGLSMNNSELVEFLKNINPRTDDIDIELNYTRVLCGLKIPGIKKQKISKTVNKLDIKPTLCYLCGIEDGFSLGTNMFGKKDFVCLNNERIIAKDYYFDEEWYDIKSGEKIDLDNINTETKEKLQDYYNYMKKEIDLSNSIIVNNLLKNQ